MNAAAARIAALLLLALAAGAARASTPSQVALDYRVLRDGLYIADAHETFSRERASYRIVSETVPAGIAAALLRGSLLVTSSGTVTAGGLQPERFDWQRGDDPRRHNRADFDWPGQTLTMVSGGNAQTAALAAGMQDRLSIMYQFMFEPVATMTQYAAQLTNGAHLQSYTYAVAGTVELDTPLGKMATLHLVKQTHAGDRSTHELWLARDHHFLPVKLVVQEGGGARTEQIVTRIEIR